jgi:hypothetical protein
MGRQGKCREFFPMSGRKRLQRRENAEWRQKGGAGAERNVALRSPSPRRLPLPGTLLPSAAAAASGGIGTTANRLYGWLIMGTPPYFPLADEGIVIDFPGGK